MPGEDPPLLSQLHSHHRRHLRDVHQDECRAQLQGVGMRSGRHAQAVHPDMQPLAETDEPESL